MGLKENFSKGNVLRDLILVTLVIGFVFSSTISINAAGYDAKDTFSQSSPFILANFDSRKPMNSLSGQTGVFDGDPDDSEASCRMGYAKDNELNKDGYHMKLSYDVDSSKPAFNGFWTKLNGADLSKFEAFSISIKGDPAKGFSDIFKIEMKDKSRKIEAVVEGVSDKWSQIIIPFADFDGEVDSVDWKNMTELVLVFEDWRLKTKEGRYYIDDISFVTKKGEKVKYSDLLK
jgi:hypothetical protein